jgi:hypothetical protein
MKVCSNSSFTLSPSDLSTGSSTVSCGLPPRLSSQFADQRIFMSLPVSSDLGRATGVCFWDGALVSVS